MTNYTIPSLLYNAYENSQNWLSWNQVYYRVSTGNQTETVQVIYNGNQTQATWAAWNEVYVPASAEAVYRYSVQPPMPNVPDIHNIAIPTFEPLEPEPLWRENAKRRAAAAEVAEDLLMKMLTPAQREQYRERGYFETEVNDRCYRIHRRSYAGNIERIEKGRAVESLCCHLRDGSIPLHDHLVAQLLWLQSDETSFRNKANITRLPR